MARMVITELSRSGAGVLTDTPVVFEWDSNTRTSNQGRLGHMLAVKTVRTEPAGSDEPVEQVMSATWQPFDFQGEWRDSWAGSGFAMSTYRDFARMVARTPLVRIELDQLSFVGIIQNLTIDYETRDRIGWHFTFSPHTNDTVGSPRPAGGISVPAKPVQQRVDEAVDQMKIAQAFAEIGLDLPLSTEDALDMQERDAEMEAAIDRLSAKAAAGIATDSPERDLLALASDFRRVREAGHSAALQLASKRSDLMVAVDDALTTMRADEWIHGTIAAAALAAGLSRAAELDMRSTAERKPIAVYRTIDGDSLERIAKRYYGTPDAWTIIYDANHLDSVHLTGGIELIIPERSA